MPAHAGTSFPDLPLLAKHLRDVLDKKVEKKPGKSPFVLLYAFNITGKTRSRHWITS